MLENCLVVGEKFTHWNWCQNLTTTLMAWTTSQWDHAIPSGHLCSVLATWEARLCLLIQTIMSSLEGGSNDSPLNNFTRNRGIEESLLSLQDRKEAGREEWISSRFHGQEASGLKSKSWAI